MLRLLGTSRKINFICGLVFPRNLSMQVTCRSHAGHMQVTCKSPVCHILTLDSLPPSQHNEALKTVT